MSADNRTLAKAAEIMAEFWELEALGLVEHRADGVYVMRPDDPRVIEWQTHIPPDADLLLRGTLLARVRQMLRRAVEAGAPAAVTDSLIAFAHRVGELPMAEVEAQLSAVDERRAERRTFH